MLANLVADDGPYGADARRAVTEAGGASIPDLADVEAVAVLRKRWIARAITADRFADAIHDLAELPFRRYPASPVLQRVYELRATVTAYDAVYVALAEELDCDLVTLDSRIARAPGPRCKIRVLGA